MGASDDVMAACGRHNGEVQINDTQCARFVSDMFKEAGQGKVFPWSTWVPTIVASWPANRVLVTNEVVLASVADLIVFGADEHIGIFAGNGRVWNTNGGGGTTKVQLQGIKDIRTHSGGGFSKILRTELSLSSGIGPAGSLGNAAADAAAGLFGSMFGWVPGFAVAVLVIVFAAVLALEGGRMMLESTTGN